MGNNGQVCTVDCAMDPFMAIARLINEEVGIGAEMIDCNLAVCQERNSRHAITSVSTTAHVRLRHNGFTSEKHKCASTNPIRAFKLAYVAAMREICLENDSNKAIILYA